ncbi:MAG: indole-3-glycerol phosphate synthase TrpC [Gemmataceae bacterium]
MTILDTIVETKRQEIASRRGEVSEGDLSRQVKNAPPPRDFYAALARPGEMNFLTEVKKASPSAGVIRADFDPVTIGTAYQEGGAAAISVLTDTHYFQGHLDYLSAVRDAVELPVLRKDFILEPYQVLEARVAGADAVLLIAEILDDNALSSLLEVTHSLGMSALVELYDRENLNRVVDAGAKLIGINNRDLRTFETRLEHTLELAEHIPNDRCLVSESGIRTREDIVRLRKAGVRAVLIGETLMRAENIVKKIHELRGIC